jgi:hypothetical protein
MAAIDGPLELGSALDHRRRTRVQNGYVSPGTSGHARPLGDLKNRSVFSENVDARPYLSFPRNEGVPGSSPGVGFSLLCRVFISPRQSLATPLGTKRVHPLTRSRLMKWSPPTAETIVFAGISRDDGGRTAMPGRARAMTGVPGDAAWRERETPGTPQRTKIGRLPASFSASLTQILSDSREEEIRQALSPVHESGGTPLGCRGGSKVSA